MSFASLLVRNLRYHWRGNLAVFLGIALGTAVLTGALLVGDSLRGSLRALTLEQLGWVEQAMVPGRFFRDSLDRDLPAERKVSLLMLQGSATTKNERVGRVNVLGIQPTFRPAGGKAEKDDFWASASREVVINQTLARALAVKEGESITLHVQRADIAPRESLMGQRKAERVIEPLDVKVRRIIPDEGMARFSLKPTPEAVANAFVPIRLLQDRLDLAGKANVILAAGNGELQKEVQKHLTLEDWGLRYRTPRDRAEAFVRFLGAREAKGAKLKEFKWRGHVPDALAKAAEKNGGVLTTEHVIAFYEEHRDYSTLESKRMFVEPQVVRALERLDPRPGIGSEKHQRWRWTPILTYLADSISNGKNEMPYAIIASDDRIDPKTGRYAIADDEILLVDWPGSPLELKAKSPIEVTYFIPDQRNELVKKSASFKLHAFPPPKIEGVLDDPDLTPEFPGITDKLKMEDWDNPPFPYDKERGKKGESFWKRYKTTPRAYLNLKKAQELWGTRFGNVTSIQVRNGQEPASSLAKALLDELKAEQGGFVFQPVREQALQASGGATDFGVLFLSFSFFLIVAALLLVGLLVRLNIDRRAGEMGLLLACGWSHARLRWLLLGEGAMLTLVGGLAGIAGAIVYAYLMLKLLSANWPGGAGLGFLRVHAEPTSFLIGYGASVIVSLATLYWATRMLGGLTPRALLHGETTAVPMAEREKSGYAPAITVLTLLLAGLLIVLGIRAESHVARAGMFFGSGACLLTAALSAAWVQLRWLRHESAPQPTLSRLGIRNAARHLVRSILTIGLLAAASFLIVAVESFHKDTDQHFHEKTGGSGGFALFAEGSLPVFEDLNQRTNVNATFYSCRVQPGDDASCLNLYRPLQPRVMSFSKALIDRGGFHFAASEAQTDAEKANPWLLLEKEAKDVIPAVIDANTAQWILKVGVGETIDVNDEKGDKIRLRIVGTLHESIFQSEVLVSEANFLKLFPRQEGASFFLIESSDPDPKTLNVKLADTGLDVQTTASRLQSYLAVENMYLATFQALGGLGLILGAMGLAIVLLRGVWERRAELALLLALGFRSRQLAWLVLVENAFLLALGLAAGGIAALIAVAPHLIGSGAQVLWLRIIALIAIVLIVGLLAAMLAIVATLRTPVLTALRRE